MAAIGTVSHELGHVLAARAAGYATTLHYGSTELRADQIVPDRATLMALALIGLVVCWRVATRHHPAGQRLALVLVGPASALIGFALWYGVPGPRLLP